MHLPVRWALILVCAGLVGTACDRVEALKDQLLGSSGSEGESNPDIDEMRSLYESGQYDAALQKIASVIQSDPNLAEAYYYKGRCHLARAGEADVKAPLSPEEEASLEAFQRALSINPRHALSEVGVGDLYLRRAQTRRGRRGQEDPEDPFQLAKAAYEKAVTIDPLLPEAQLSYGMFLVKAGELEAAEQAYKSAVEGAATVPEIAPDYYLAYGQFLAGPADRLDEALDQFELAQMFRQDDLRIQEQMAIVHARVGQRHFEKQEYMLAEDALTLAESLFPNTDTPEAQQAAATLAQLRSIRRR